MVPKSRKMALGGGMLNSTGLVNKLLDTYHVAPAFEVFIVLVQLLSSQIVVSLLAGRTPH